MIQIEYNNGETKGFEFEPQQEKAVKALLEMLIGTKKRVNARQVDIIKSVWSWLHDPYLQDCAYFRFTEDYLFIKKEKL